MMFRGAEAPRHDPATMRLKSSYRGIDTVYSRQSTSPPSPSCCGNLHTSIHKGELQWKILYEAVSDLEAKSEIDRKLTSQSYSSYRPSFRKEKNRCAKPSQIQSITLHLRRAITTCFRKTPPASNSAIHKNTDHEERVRDGMGWGGRFRTKKMKVTSTTKENLQMGGVWYG